MIARTSVSHVGFDLNYANHRRLLRHQRLLVGGGYIRQIERGIFSFLPIGSLVVGRLVQLIKTIFSSYGVEELMLPVVQGKSLWMRSGRLDKFSASMAYANNDLIISPSHEEVVCSLLPRPLSWRQLPRVYMNIGHCYREERRPKNGLLRGREFLLLDGYGISADRAGHQEIYQRVRQAFVEIMLRLKLDFKTAYFSTAEEAELSEEFVVATKDIGEKRLLICSCGAKYRYPQFSSCPCGGSASINRAIEFGDLVRCGTSLTSKLEINATDKSGNSRPAFLLSFGLGISKLIGAMIEAADKSFVWPDTIAPYYAAIVPARERIHEAEGICERIESQLGLRVLLDDRDLSIGRRVKEMLALALPYAVVLGGKGAPYELFANRAGCITVLQEQKQLLASMANKED